MKGEGSKTRYLKHQMSRNTEIIYGIHAVRHAFKKSPEEILELWVQEGKQGSGEVNQILDLASAAGISVSAVSREAMERAAGNSVHQGILLRRKTTPTKITDLDSLLSSLKDRIPLLLVLDGVQDPHNLGACLRTANATGVDAIIVPRDRAVAVTATVRKIASGAAEHTPVITVTNLARSLDRIREQGIWCFGLSDQAQDGIYTVDLTVPLALVLGAEGKGLRQNTRNHCDKLVQIPMAGEVESLNVSVAAAVCLYEAVRQRRNPC